MAVMDASWPSLPRAGATGLPRHPHLGSAEPALVRGGVSRPQGRPFSGTEANQLGRLTVFKIRGVLPFMCILW